MNKEKLQLSAAGLKRAFTPVETGEATFEAVLTGFHEQDPRFYEAALHAVIESEQEERFKIADVKADKIASLFKQHYIAHRVFGVVDSAYADLCDALAQASKLPFEEGVALLQDRCSLEVWKDAVKKSADSKDFSLLFSKIQLEAFVSEDAGKGFLQFLQIWKDKESQPKTEEVIDPVEADIKAFKKKFFEVVGFDKPDSKTIGKTILSAEVMKELREEASSFPPAMVAQFITILDNHCEVEAAPEEQSSLLAVLHALQAEKAEIYGAMPDLQTLSDDLKGKVEAGAIVESEQLKRDFDYGFAQLEKAAKNQKFVPLAIRNLLLARLAYLETVAPSIYGEMKENSRAANSLKRVVSHITEQIDQHWYETNDQVDEAYSVACSADRWLKAAHQKQIDEQKANQPDSTITDAVKTGCESAIKFFKEKFKPEDRIALLKDMPLTNFLAISDYTSNRDAHKRAESAKAPTATNSNGKHPHLVGKLTAPQQKIVKVLQISKEKCPKTWEAVEAVCAANGVPSTLPYVIGDAHSRKYAWMIKGDQDGWKLERPESVDVMIFSKNVNGEDFTDADFFKFVEAECSKFTAFTNEEINEVSLIEAGLDKSHEEGLQSAFVIKNWLNPVKIYGKGKVSLKDVRIKFKQELKTLDLLGLPASVKAPAFDKYHSARMSSGVKAAILASFDIAKTHNLTADDVIGGFWQDLYAPMIEEGSVSEDQHVLKLITWIKNAGRKNRETNKDVENIGQGAFDAGVFAEAKFHVENWCKDYVKAQAEENQEATAE